MGMRLSVEGVSVGWQWASWVGSEEGKAMGGVVEEGGAPNVVGGHILSGAG